MKLRGITNEFGLYHRVDPDSILSSFEMSSNQESLNKQQYNIERPQILLYK